MEREPSPPALTLLPSTRVEGQAQVDAERIYTIAFFLGLVVIIAGIAVGLIFSLTAGGITILIGISLALAALTCSSSDITDDD